MQNETKLSRQHLHIALKKEKEILYVFSTSNVYLDVHVFNLIITIIFEFVKFILFYFLPFCMLQIIPSRNW